MAGQGNQRRRSRKRPRPGPQGLESSVWEGQRGAAPGPPARFTSSWTWEGRGTARGPADAPPAPSMAPAGRKLQHESRCRPSRPVDAWRAAATTRGRCMGTPGARRRARRGGWGLPRTSSGLAAAGLLCTALTACLCWGQLPPLPWASPAPQRPVSVLLWWEPFGGRGGHSKPPPDCSLRFNISGCRLLTDRAAYGEAQAVLFHHRDLVKGPPDWPPPWGAQERTDEAPELRVFDDQEGAVMLAREALETTGSRPPGQRWVWMNFESPSHTPGLRGLAKDLFNWTLSYRTDSDIFVPYGFLYPRSHPAEQPSGLGPPLARKRGLVAWVVSHWNERQARVRYYHQLRRHVSVDVFGRAGPGQPVPAVGLLHTVARYKFYLAFENSQHVDYITEKLWRNAFLAGAVPVVLGPDRANYERFVPRGSFIHVDDFPSAASLAAYLLFLDRNVAVYRRYFHWRRSYAVHITSFWDEPWCQTCRAVQTSGDQPKSIHNLADWFQR